LRTTFVTSISIGVRYRRDVELRRASLREKEKVKERERERERERKESRRKETSTEEQFSGVSDAATAETIVDQGEDH